MSVKAVSAIVENSSDRPLEASLGYLVRDTHRLISRLLQERLERHGIGLGQWYLLRALWMQDGLTQRELGARVGMGEPNVVIALRGLEAAKLIRRTPDASDGRRRLVRLTPKGREREQELMPIAGEINNVIASALRPGERDELIRLIQQVRQNLLDL